MASIDTRGLEAGAPQRTTSTEGQATVPGVDLSAFGNLIIAGKRLYDKEKASAATTEKARVANEYEQGALDIKIGAATGDFDRVARVAVEHKESTGRDMTEAEQVALRQLESVRAKLDSAVAQGKPELAANLAMMVHQRRFLAKYPHMEPDIVKLNNPDMFNKAIDLAYEEERATRARQEEGLKARDTVLRARGFDTTGMPERDKAVVYAGVQRDVAALASLNERVALMEGGEKLDAASRSRVILEEAEKITPALGRLLVTNVNLQMQSGRDPAERAALGRVALAEMVGKLGKTLGGGKFTADPVKVRERYGYLIDAVAANIDSLAADPNEATLKSYETKSKIHMNLLEEHFYAQNPGSRTFQMLGKVLTPAGMQMLSGSPTLQNLVGTFVVNTAKTLGMSPGDDRYLRDVTNGRGIQAPAGELADRAKQTSAAASAAYALPDTPESQPLKQGAAIEALSYLASPQVNKGSDYKALRGALGAVSNPGFVPAMGGRKVPLEAKVPVYDFTNAAGAAAQKIVTELKAGGGKVSMDAAALKAGQVRFVVSGKTESDPEVRRLRQAERDMTDGIKASAHMDGRVDYDVYFKQFGWR